MQLDIMHPYLFFTTENLFCFLLLILYSLRLCNHTGQQMFHYVAVNNSYPCNISHTSHWLLSLQFDRIMEWKNHFGKERYSPCFRSQSTIWFTKFPYFIFHWLKNSTSTFHPLSSSYITSVFLLTVIFISTMMRRCLLILHDNSFNLLGG